MILAGINNDKLIAHRINGVNNYFQASRDDSYALVNLKNGKTRRHEFYFGSTYLSQSSRSLKLSKEIEALEVFTFSGKKK
jgi:hypothetical protein